MIATTGGYIGDTPPYQGHVVVIGAKHGRLLHVWNSLCSGHHGLIYPPRCTPSDSAIWGRAGAVVVPGSGKLLVATGNGPWDGHSNWGDAVLVLSAKAKLVGNYTPTNTAQLNVQDIDLGSTSPVYLTSKLIAQGGKDGKIRLLSLRRLRGTRPHKGHELQIVSTPSGTDLFTAPAVWRSGKQVWLIAADGGGTQAWSLSGGRLHSVWRNGHGGTSPVIAGGLLWVYDLGGGLRVYQPASGKLVTTLSAGGGHWNSPIVTDGRVALPEGDANDHATSGVLDIWRLGSRVAAAHLRRLLAERRVGERLQRLVQRRELAGDAEEVLVVVEALVRLRELVGDPVEPLEDQVEAPVGEVVLHPLIVVLRAPGATARRPPRRRAQPAPRRACRRPPPAARRPRARARARRAPAARR